MQKDYNDEPYTEQFTMDEDGARLASPGMFKHKKISKKINRGSGRNKSEKRKRTSINLGQNTTLHSYFNHIQAQAVNKGYTSLAKGMKSNDREMNLK